MKKMMMTSCLLIAFLTSSFAQADAISTYFEQYLDDDRFTVVYISGKMFSMISQIDSDDEDFDEIQQVTNNLKGLRILVADEDALSLYKEAKAKINTKSGYELLMTVRTKDKTNVEFVVKETGNKIDELLLIAGGEGQDFVLMSFVGDIDLEHISKLSKSIDIEGMEHLEELEKKEKKNNKN